MLFENIISLEDIFPHLQFLHIQLRFARLFRVLYPARSSQNLITSNSGFVMISLWECIGSTFHRSLQGCITC